MVDDNKCVESGFIDLNRDILLKSTSGFVSDAII